MYSQSGGASQLDPLASSADEKYVKTFTATAARRRFGALIKAVQHEPVPVLVIRRNGDKAIFISAEKYKQMCGISTIEPEPVKLARKATNFGRSR